MAPFAFIDRRTTTVELWMLLLLLVLISVALRPAMVALAFGMRHAEKPLALHRTRTSAGGRTRTGYSQVWAIRPGLVLATHGALSRLVLLR